MKLIDTRRRDAPPDAPPGAPLLIYDPAVHPQLFVEDLQNKLMDTMLS